MNRALPVSLALAGVLLLGSCGSDQSPAALAEANITAMEDLGATLAKITDKASAEKNTAALERLATRIKDLKERMEKAGAPSDADSEKLMKQHGPALGTAMNKLTQEMMRIGMDPELQAIVGPALEKIDM